MGTFIDHPKRRQGLRLIGKFRIYDALKAKLREHEEIHFKGETTSGNIGRATEGCALRSGS